MVPVFWIAGEDHDFDEVDHIHVLSRELKVEKIRLERQGDAKAPVSDIAISGEQWTKALDRLESMLPDTEFKPGLLEKITQFASDSGSLVDLFARLLAWWFGKHGLVLLDSHDPALRRLEAPMFAWMLGKHRGTEPVFSVRHERRGNTRVQAPGGSSG